MKADNPDSVDNQPRDIRFWTSHTVVFGLVLVVVLLIGHWCSIAKEGIEAVRMVFPICGLLIGWIVVKRFVDLPASVKQNIRDSQALVNESASRMFWYLEKRQFSSPSDDLNSASLEMLTSPAMWLVCAILYAITFLDPTNFVSISRHSEVIVHVLKLGGFQLVLLAIVSCGIHLKALKITQKEAP